MSSGSQSQGSQSRASLYCLQLWNLWRLWEQGPSFKHWHYGSLSLPSSSVTFKAESRRGLTCTPSGLVFALHRRRLWRGPTPSWTGALTGHEINGPQRTSFCAEWKLVLWGTWTWWSKAYSSSTRMRSTDGVDVSMHKKRTAKDTSSTGCWIPSTPSCEGGCQGPAREMTSQWLTSEHKMTGSLAALESQHASGRWRKKYDGRNMTEDARCLRILMARQWVFERAAVWQCDGRKMTEDAWGSWRPGCEFLKGQFAVAVVELWWVQFRCCQFTEIHCSHLPLFFSDLWWTFYSCLGRAELFAFPVPLQVSNTSQSISQMMSQVTVNSLDDVAAVAAINSL